MVAALRVAIATRRWNAISSRQNPLVRRFRDARARRGRATALLLLDGEHLLDEALASRRRDRASSAFAERLADASAAALADECAHGAARASSSCRRRCSRRSARCSQPSGVVGDRAASDRATLDARARRGTPGSWSLMLHERPGPRQRRRDRPRGGRRAARPAIVCSDGTADPFGWKALRGAMGSTFRLPIAVRQPIARDAVATRARGGIRDRRHRRRAAARRCRTAICAVRRRSSSAAKAPGLPSDRRRRRRRAADDPDAARRSNR